MSGRPLVCGAGLHPMTDGNLTVRGQCKQSCAARRRASRAAGRPVLPVSRPPAWMDDALCAQSDPDAWFPERGESANAPKRVCAACLVRDECLEYALTRHEIDGIWGGLSYAERRAEAQRRIRASAA